MPPALLILNEVSQYLKIILISSLLLTIINGCDLPNGLPPAECLEFTPLNYYLLPDSSNGYYNISIYHNDTEVSSKAFAYSDIQKDLVLEFNDSGKLYYWFKKDYLKLPSGEVKHSDQLQLRHIYKNGRWKANFIDSSITIDFGKNDFSLAPIDGKYTDLGVGILHLQQTFTFDSSVNGKKETFKKLVNTYFTGY